MTAALDFIVAWLRRLLGWLPEPVANAAWLPVFVVLLVVALRLVQRHGLLSLAKLTQKVASVVITLVALPLMTIVVAGTALFRLLRAHPPGLLLGLDDAIVAVATSIGRGLEHAGAVAAKVSRVNVVLVIALAVVVVWRWDAGHCEAPATPGCLRPVAVWANYVGINKVAASTATANAN
jgi:hypothetical protein